jgi:hypothetical protein
MADKMTLDVLRTFARELRDCVWSIHEYRTGREIDEDLFTLYENRLQILEELIRRHRRALEYTNGHPIKPEVQYAEAVIAGAGS